VIAIAARDKPRDFKRALPRLATPVVLEANRLIVRIRSSNSVSLLGGKLIKDNPGFLASFDLD
jgi:hypothetical protein